MALQLIPLGPPAFDSFTPLSQIGQSFFKQYDDSRKRKLEDDFAKSNSEIIAGMSAPVAPVAAPQAGTLGDMGKPSRALPTFAQADTPSSPVTGLNPQTASLTENLKKQFPEVRITSGYRDPSRNAAVGGAKGSQHIHGNAFDFSVKGLPEERQQEIATWLRNNGAQGFGYYPGSQSMHADFGPARAWGPNYRSDSLGQTPQWFQQFAGAKPGQQTAPAPVAQRAFTAYAGVPSAAQPPIGGQDATAVLTGGEGPSSAPPVPLPPPRPPMGLGGGMPQSGGVAPAQPAPQQMAQASPGPGADPFGFSRMPPQVAAGVKALLRNPLPAAQARGMAIVEMYKKTEQWSGPVTDPRTGAEFQVNRVTGERKIFQQPQDNFTVKIDDQGNRLQVNTRNNQQTMLVAAKDLPTEVKLYNQARSDGSFTGPFNDFLLQRQRGARQYQTIDIEVPGSNGKQTFIIDPDTNKLKTPAEMGLKVSPDGSLNPYSPGGKPTEAQEKSIGFVGRMVNSEKVIQDNESAGLGFGESLSSQVPLVGNFLTSTDFKKYNQAKMDFILAVLRKESGAVIGQSEFDMAAKQYFPQPGDPPELLDQKRATRRLAIEGMMAGTGPNYKPPEGYGGPANRGTPGQPPEPPPAPTSPNVPAQGERKLGDVIIPPDAVRELKAAKDTPQTRKAFDSVFGAGAADKLLGRPK